MSEKIKPTQSEEVEVSSQIETTGGAATPAPGLPPVIPLSQLRGANLSVLTPEERKARKKANDAESYKNRANKKKTSSFAYNSTVEIKPKDARLILQEERNIRNPRILEVCVELAQVASRNLKIPFNASLFKKGLQGTLAAAEGIELPAFPADEWHAGERAREHELWATWDYACSWRTQPDGTQLSFEDWKVYRRRCITGIVWFANTALGKSFEQEPHGRWAEELFPQLEPALLSLPEEFGQKDIAKAFH